MAEELEDPPDKRSEVFFATLAEQAERYDDMCEHMSTAAMLEKELDNVERNLLAVAYKQAVGWRRNSWRIICNVEMIEQGKGNDDMVNCAKKYREQVESELSDKCKKIIGMLFNHLIPNSTNAESKVQYYKAQGDYYRYLAEIQSNDKDKTKCSSLSKISYEDGTFIAMEDLPPTSQHRLGLALNHAVFYYEILGKPVEAVRIARKAFEDAVRESDNPDQDDKKAKESGLIMQLLRDNLTLWTADDS